MIYLGYASIGKTDVVFDPLQLSDYRLKKLENIRNESVRAQSIAAEMLLNKMAVELGFVNLPPLDIRVGKHGKPYTEGFFFSLSHSDDMVLCALSDNEIGADIQLIKPFDMRVAERCFCDDELVTLQKAEDKDEAFIRIWTMKESSVKLSGEGIGVGLHSFSVLDSSLNIHTGQIGRYCWAVCSRSDEEIIINEYSL